MDGASRGEQAGERECERPGSTTQVGPRRRPQRANTTIGEHLDRVALSHSAIIVARRLVDSFNRDAAVVGALRPFYFFLLGSSAGFT